MSEEMMREDAVDGAASGAEALGTVAPEAVAAGHVRSDGARSSLSSRLRAADPVRVLAAALVVVFAIALLPMVAISRYDHSYADDWHYGVDAHAVLEAGEGIAGAVGAAVEEAIDTYDSWQGTYSAIVLMSLQPGVFGEGLYGLGAIGIIATLVLATGYAASVAVRDVCGGGRSEWLCVTCAALLLQTQLLPSPVEGFWWYNSAIYYTFFHALLLFGAGLTVRLLRGHTHRGSLSAGGVAVRTGALVVLAFVVGGGNYVTGLVAVVALAGVVVAAFVRRQKAARLLVPALLVLAAGFACSMAAPGNAARQASQFPGDNLGVLLTLVRSGFAGFEYALLWTNGYLVLALALLVPVFARLARRSTCSFALPAVPAITMVLLFMASFAPTFFSMGNVGPGRVQNIRYDFFVLAVFLCVGWLVGWVVRRVERRALRAEGASGSFSPQASASCPESGICRNKGAREAAYFGKSQILDNKRAWGAEVPATRSTTARAVRPLRKLRPRLFAYLACCMLVLVMTVASLAIDERHRDDLVSISAASSLFSGEAREYDEQVRERLELLETTDDLTVDVPYYTAGPRVLFMGDIRDNMDNYINYRLAQWYGKESIIGYYGTLG